MSLMEGFTRPEVIKLTGLSSDRLAYFDRTGLVVPAKFGCSRKPTCIYSWEQLLQLLAIKDLRRKVSLQTVRQIINFFEKEGFSETLRNKHLVICGNNVLWVEDDWKDFPEKILKLSGKKDIGNYAFTFMVTVNDLIDAIWVNAKRFSESEFKSFKQRAKAYPKSVVA